MTNNVVFNQDDAVAVTSGGDIVWDNSYCYGGHGASIGSVGLKSNNTVDGVIFSNTQIVASQNGARIKTNSGASGTINNVTYSNIQVQDISIYGVSQGLCLFEHLLMAASPFLRIHSLTFSRTTVSKALENLELHTDSSLPSQRRTYWATHRWRQYHQHLHAQHSRHRLAHCRQLLYPGGRQRGPVDMEVYWNQYQGRQQ